MKSETMTLEEKPLYRAGEKPSTLGKYGPSAVRDIRYVDKGGLDKPIVSVRQRKNGQYVVVEKLPAKNFQQRHKFKTVEQSLEETGVKFRSIKPSWKYWTKKNEVDKNPNPALNPAYYYPGKYPRSLPPIDLGWKAEPLVGSMMNAEHQPGGGDKPIFKEKLKWKAKAKVGSLDNVDYNIDRSRTSQSDPINERPYPSARYGAIASIGSSLSRSHYNPAGGLEVIKKSNKFEHVRSRVGSLDNATHQAGGGDVNIFNQRLKWKGGAKVGSLDNIHHQPEGGDIYIMNQRLTWKSKPRVGSLDNAHHQPQTTIGKIPNFKLEWDGRPRVGSLDNIHHTPRGGNVMIHSKRLRWKAEAKVGSLPPMRASMGDLSLEDDY